MLQVGASNPLNTFTFSAETMNNNAKVWTNDLSTLVERYAEQIMDGMDMKTMEQFVFDTLVDNLTNYSEDELIAEIREYNPDLLVDS